MSYRIQEVDGEQHAEEIHRFNGLYPEIFPPLTDDHLAAGFWFFAYHDAIPCAAIACVGMVPFTPFDRFGVWYVKRAVVLPDHRSHGLQTILFTTAEARARGLGFKMLVSECGGDNHASARSILRSGYEPFEPEQKWGAPGSIYFLKCL